MKHTNSRIERLKALMSLEEKRATLQEEIDNIANRVTELGSTLFSDGGTTSEATTAPTAPKKAPRAAAKRQVTPRGALKDKIMAALEAAGDAGVHVKEVAQALGTKAVNVHSWFHSSTKRNPAIKKIQGGHYKLQGTVSKSSPSTNGRKEKATAATAKGKSKSVGTRGQVSASILQAMQAAGAKGISLRDLSDKLGANYKNISVWFSTTGKKNPSIKKISPGVYRLTR